MEHSAKHLQELGRALANGALPDAIQSEAAKKLALYLSRLCISLAVAEGSDGEFRAKAAKEMRSLIDAIDDCAQSQESRSARFVSALDAMQALKASVPENEEQLAAQFSELEQAICTILGELEQGGDKQKLTNRFLEILSSRCEAINDARQRLSSTENAASNAHDADRFNEDQKQKLQQYLHEFTGEEAPPELIQLKPVFGGYSKQTFFLTITNNGELSDSLAIRYDAEDSVLGTAVRDEFELMRVAHKHGVKVPEPYCLENTGDVLGAPFMLTRRVWGESIGDSHHVDRGDELFGASLAVELAKLHAIPLSEFKQKIPGDDVTTQERMQNDLTFFREMYLQCNYNSSIMLMAFDRLANNIELAGSARSLIHCDVGCHNFVVDNGKIEGLCDWETARIGNPAQDLGYAYKTAIQVMPWDNFLDAYNDAGGQIPSEQEISFYDLWGRLWIAVYSASAKFAFENDLTDNVQLAYAGEHIHQRDLGMIVSKLKELNQQ